MTTTDTTPALPERFLPIPEVSRILGLKPRHVADLVRRGHLPRPLKVGPRAAVWTPSMLVSWQAGLRSATGGIPATFRNRRAALGLKRRKAA